MSLSPGTRIGPYDVTAQIGAGGMGEVYRARDTKLQRDVALKILPEAFASDPERLARFTREAQVLASLNHPHIAAIHGIEDAPADAGLSVRALVLELVEGPTLADRIAQGPLPLSEAMAIATQVAEALEVAHEQGIVHRDLKPANIKVRDDGTVKVLDFGLAKLVAAPQTINQSATLSPTITTPAMTQLGVILGTAAYMSPEQAKGREADKRSDIWAFGAVLYEMLTGRQAFDGEDMVDVLGAVARLEPDWTRLPADLPPAVRTLLQRCLTKDRRQRLSDISTARFIFAEFHSLGVATTASEASRPHVTPPIRRPAVLPIASAALLTALVVGAGAWALHPAATTPVVAKFSTTLPEGQAFSGTGRQTIAVSPDGTLMAYVANARIYLRSFGEFEPHQIPGIESGQLGLAHLMFAPGGQSIAYFTFGEAGTNLASATLKRIPIGGGAASTLATVENAPFGGSWGPDGILIGQGRAGILRVPATGGMPSTIVEVGRDEFAHGPQMLPDGRTVLFTLATAVGRDDRWDSARIVAQSLDDGTRRVLVEGGSDARYLPTGHLVYAVSGTMFAVPFDVDRLAVTGSAVPVVVGVRRSAGGQTGATHLSISETGTLAYVSGPATPSATARGLVVGDGRADPVSLKVPPASYSHPRVSPDGRTLAVGRTNGDASDVWTLDLSGATEILRRTFDGQSSDPVWSADSRRVTFQSSRDGARGIFWQAADGRGTAEQLTKAAEGEEHIPEAWSPDGTKLLFSVLKDGVYTLSTFVLETRTVEPFGRVTSAERLSATFSPDGRWVAYAATERAGGTLSPDRGVFVEPVPPTGEKHQIPKTGLDYHPVWAPDGRSIFLVPSSTRPTVSVPVTTRPSIAFGTPVELTRFPRPGVLSTGVRGYDVLPDGRLLSLNPVPGDSSATASPANEIRVVVNWFEELKRLVPSN